MGIYVVTGSASGMGGATAEQLTLNGDMVIGVDLRDAEVNVDLSTAEGRSSLVPQVQEHLTRLGARAVDGVVAAAGLGTGTTTTVAVNYFGAVATLENLRQLMVRGSRAVVIGSVSAVHRSLSAVVSACLEGDEPAALAATREAIELGRGAGVYGSTKVAISRWVRRSAALPSWAGSGLLLNAVGPGLVATAMTRELFADPAVFASVQAAVPMPLRTEPSTADEIARVVTWLAGPSNTVVTGQVVYADAGADAALRGDAVW